MKKHKVRELLSNIHNGLDRVWVAHHALRKKVEERLEAGRERDLRCPPAPSAEVLRQIDILKGAKDAHKGWLRGLEDRIKQIETGALIVRDDRIADQGDLASDVADLTDAVATLKSETQAKTKQNWAAICSHADHLNRLTNDVRILVKTPETSHADQSDVGDPADWKIHDLELRVTAATNLLKALLENLSGRVTAFGDRILDLEHKTPPGPKHTETKHNLWDAISSQQNLWVETIRELTKEGRDQ
ncbi:MAG: hypothetical protein MUQ56_05775 [Thermoleophilia bacterium]|nr:hypothetical protein [Thermoleophilia bacterium]